MQDTLPDHEVVLLGVGHTNAHVLRMWRMQPIPNARLTCVSNYPVATYSGMLPGVLAGLYPPERMTIDLVRLCAAAGARLIVGNVTGFDIPGRRLFLEDRPAIPFDVLSIGIGSVPRHNGVNLDDATVLPIKPMQTFIDRLETRLQNIADRNPTRSLKIVVVGGGAGGIEISFCLPNRVRRVLGDVPLQLTLVDPHERVMHGAPERTSRLVHRLLEQRGHTVKLGRRVRRMEQGLVTLDDGSELDADIILWATSAATPELLRACDLPHDDEGFLLTHPTLQTVADEPVFVVGDSGTIRGDCLPKAGVYAVRQGPILWENIRNLLDGRRLKPYKPQRNFLKLLNTGDGRAVAEYYGATFHGRWCWALKDSIDRRFMDKYQDYAPMEMTMAAPSAGQPVMRCAGCGGKVSGTVLSHVLERLDVPDSEHVLLGLDAPDDAAIIQSPHGRPIAVTADFFAAPLDDAYLVGRIAALNAASDVFALGSKPIAALALVTIPPGNTCQQEELLNELLSGSTHEFRKMPLALVGGHTLEGPQLTVGFTVLADVGPNPPHRKGDLRAGDVLVLTKPLGTGVLLAAHMTARCRWEWMETLLRTMLTSNQMAATLLDEFDIRGVTDVTGFGFAGHLLEMLQAGDKAADVYLGGIPVLPGVEELISEGVESTLAPANRAAESEMDVPDDIRDNARYAALFDPQTNGGLLFGVKEHDLDTLLRRLLEENGGPAIVVGRVTEPTADRPRMTIVRSAESNIRSREAQERR